MPPPASARLIESPGPEPILRLDQLWRQLPTQRQQVIGARLAQMIARQIAAMHVPPIEQEEEEHDE